MRIATRLLLWAAVQYRRRAYRPDEPTVKIGSRSGAGRRHDVAPADREKYHHMIMMM
jgi:hypothetical protein